MATLTTITGNSSSASSHLDLTTRSVGSQTGAPLVVQDHPLPSERLDVLVVQDHPAGGRAVAALESGVLMWAGDHGPRGVLVLSPGPGGGPPSSEMDGGLFVSGAGADQAVAPEAGGAPAGVSPSEESIVFREHQRASPTSTNLEEVSTNFVGAPSRMAGTTNDDSREDVAGSGFDFYDASSDGGNPALAAKYDRLRAEGYFVRLIFVKTVDKTISTCEDVLLGDGGTAEGNFMDRSCTSTICIVLVRRSSSRREVDIW